MMTTVRDVMSAPLPCVRDDDPVVAVGRRLRAHRAEAVPVCNADGGFLGMLTAADVIDRCLADGQDPRVMRAGALLEGTGPVVDPGEPLYAAVLGVILTRRQPTLPVVEDGGLIGMLTLDDIAGHLVDEEDDTDDDFRIGGASWWARGHLNDPVAPERGTVRDRGHSWSLPETANRPSLSHPAAVSARFISAAGQVRPRHRLRRHRRPPTTATVPVELGGTTKTAGGYDSPAGTFGITGTLTLDA